MNTKGVIKNYISNNISKMSSVIIFSLLTIGFKILNPICMKLIIDYSVKGAIEDNATMIIIFTVLMGASTVLSMICDSVRHVKTVGFGNDVTSELRSLSYQAIMKSELYEINKISNNDLSNAIVNSTRVIGDEYISGKLIKLIYDALYLCAALILMLVFNSNFAFVSILSLPLFYVVTKYLGKMLEKRQEVYIKTNDKHQYTINDHLEQLKTIKTRNAINKETETYEKTLRETRKAHAKAINAKNAKEKFVSSVFVGLLWFSLFIITCFEVFANQTYIFTELGSIIGCVALSPKIITTFKSMIDLYFTPIDTDSECAKLDKIFSVRAERRSENVPSLEEIHSLKFNSVSFDYMHYGVNDKVFLDKIEFEVKKGETLGILGLPGAGKTTIADLITKVIRPRQGNVLINNCDINKLNTYYLRDIVTYVPENFQLLNASIEENIIYPMPLDEYKYSDALNKCKLKDLIFSLPQRDSTNARKADLSASEIQKISLANAFYKESSIIILDEATSKLDPLAEEEILNELFKLKNKISIVISSRLNSLLKCDKILILNNGKVTDYGKVEELLSRNPSFARMVSDARLNKKVV